jgi:L-alanine-DL-glutamate epimerase-like enolase superfamily enzyme
MSGASLRVIEIKCWALSESLSASWRISSQTWNRLNTVIVRVRTDDGGVGVGEANSRTAPRAGVALIRDHLSPHVLGADARNIEGVWWAMFARGRPRGHTRGLYLKAMSGIDMALWDLAARRRDEPLWRALHGAGQPRVPVYASAVRVFGTIQEALEKAEEFLAAGHRTIKVMVGGRELTYDLAVLRGLRERHEDVDICVDANSGFEVTQAVRFAVAAGELDLLFLEEPVPPDNLRGYRRLRQATPIALAAGQSEFTAYAAEPLLAQGLIDFFQPNAGRVGGLTGVRYLQHAALMHAIPFSAHVGASSVINGLAALHLAAASPERTIAEYWEDESPLIDIAAGAYPAVNKGHVQLSETPGLGVEIDERELDRLAVETAVIDPSTKPLAQ